ncbi:MAG: DUF5107 domain-containing protein, partial [Bifidobacteriaceae bacterium]|nr:DUF5107 domain-containing protein [Bifidobacteriaceae bacterium]
MRITHESLILPGSHPIGANPLPALRDQRAHLDVRSNGTLLEGEAEGLGQNTGRRVLPYAVQDRYGRADGPVELQTAVLDNGLLRAVFLTGLGGRLYSLTDLASGRELLYVNPVLQPANLAIRDAWFSGGVEWNLGQYGHAASTCDPVFAGVVRDRATGTPEAFRIWEYERQRGLFWQIDFRLPPGRALLEAHVRIANPRPHPASLYWWTNAAVPQTRTTRVFSSTSQVIYQDAPAREAWARENGLPGDSAGLARAPVFFGHAQLPEFEEEGRAVDATYPSRLRRSFEYFFQVPASEPSPWEACLHADGTGYFERSTQPLRFRKMFCWGNHAGGRWWQEFLSRPGGTPYLELQAGLAPTQLHGATLGAGEELEFTQVFGGLTLPPGAGDGDWAAASGRVADGIVRVAAPADLKEADAVARRRSRVPVAEADVAARGSGWGALEEARSGQAPPEGFYYPPDSLGREQAPWLQLVRGEDPDWTAPGAGAFVVDPAWRPLMEAA